MKVIIAGGRDFMDYDKLYEYCDWVLSLSKDIEDIEIVSGESKGADTLGETYASEKGYTLTKFPADWNKHGKSAGPIRNNKMAEYSDALICFWDGKSNGSKNIN